MATAAATAAAPAGPDQRRVVAVPVAGPAHLAGLLRGPQRPATVLVSGRGAAYLGVGGGRGQDAPLLAVVAAGAVPVPCALVLPAGYDPCELLPAGGDVTVGGVAGGVTSSGTRLAVRRWWSSPPLPHGRARPSAVAALTGLLDRLDAAGRAAGAAPAPDVVTARAAAGPAAAALADGDPAKAVAALVAVLGLGPGATPSGDDVTAGVLLAARATDVPPAVLDPVAAAVTSAAAGATGAVSAALLADAAAGRCAAVVTDAVAALLGLRPPEPAFGDLVALGHTSGADLATGLLAVARTQHDDRHDTWMEPTT